MEELNPGESETNPTKEQLDKAEDFITALGIAQDETDQVSLVRDLAYMVAKNEDDLAVVPAGWRRASSLSVGTEVISAISEKTEGGVSTRLLFGEPKRTLRRVERYMRHNDPTDE